MRLYEREPACEFKDAHLLGNGRLGASIYGGIPYEEILINDDTLWSGSERYYVKEHYYENFIKARELTLAGRIREANELINNEMDVQRTEAYMPLASAHICIGQRDNRRNMRFRNIWKQTGPEAQEYSRELDLDTAVETVTYEQGGVEYKREYFVSYDRQLIFARLSAEGGPLDFSLNMDSKLKYGIDVSDDGFVLYGMAPDHSEPEHVRIVPATIYKTESNSDALRFASMMRVIDTDGTVCTDDIRIYVKDASYAVIAIAAGTNYAGYKKSRDKNIDSILKKLKGQLDDSGSWDEAREEHLLDYKALYDRMYLNLGEEVTGDLPSSVRNEMNADGVFDPSMGALAVQYARYLLISGSRPGSQALNLQGIWNDRVTPPWSSNFTTNINVEMNYWPAEQFNLSECHLPLLNLVCDCADSGKQVAEDYYHLDGWVAHHNVDLWRMCTPVCEDATWFFWPFGGTWMAEHLWTHYEFTQDLNFLRETAYPVIRECARFMLGYLCEDEGYLTTAPSISPENRHLMPDVCTYREMVDRKGQKTPVPEKPGESSPITKGSCMDIAMIREVFGNTLAGARILGIENDELIEQIRKALDRLEPFRIAKNGTLQEWHEDYEELNPGMGHVSHLFSIYPSNIINERDFPTEYKAAYLSLQRRIAHGGMRGEWPGSWALCLAARFHDRTLCTALLASVTKKFSANMLTQDHIQIDSILGFAAGVGEMLLQSHNGYIELLPTPAYGWVNGSYRGMKARGGFECDLEWKGYMPCSGRIISMSGSKCTLKAEGLRGVRMPDGNLVRPDADGMVRINTAAGKEYILMFG